MPAEREIIVPDGGVVRDVSPYLLERGSNYQLSRMKNARVRNGSLQFFPGHESLSTPSVAPYWVLPITQSLTDYFWMYAGLSAVYVVDEAGNHTDLSDSAYNATAADGWNGGVFGTIPVLNNGSDVPRQWSSTATGTSLSKISNWETDVASGATCKSLRVFRNHLVAMNTTESGTNHRQRVRWSDPGSAGSLPGWDATGTAGAGSEDLLSSYDSVVDGAQLRDRFVVYKENSTYLMTIIGGSAQMRLDPISWSSGILTTNCAVEYRNMHFVLTQGDIVVNDGNRIQSLGDKKNRNWMFSQMDSVNYERCFVCVNEPEDEIWFCFPEDGESSCTRALTYSLQDGKFGDKELPNLAYATQGEVFQTGTDDWDNDSQAWDGDSERWDETDFAPAEDQLLMASSGDTELYRQGNFGDNNGTAITSIAGRESDVFGDPDEFVRILRVRPLITAPVGMVFTIRVGVQTLTTDQITYETQTYTHGTDEFVNMFLQGKYISWEVETSESGRWYIHAMEFEFQRKGKN